MAKIKIKNTAFVILFLAPTIIPLLLFWVWPSLNAAFISFTNWDYISPQYDFVGIRNYVKLLTSREFLQAAKNTFVFCFFSTVFTVGGGLLLAMLLHKKFAGRNFFRILFFSPWITPSVAISLVWLWIFDERAGIANQVMNFLHLPSLQWIQSTKTAMIAVIIVTVWHSIGYAMIFYVNALDKVPNSLYEAAKMDLASPWQRFLKITLPGISPTTFFLCIIIMVNGLQAYDQIQILTQGGPSGSTRTLLYLYYQLGFQQYDMGQASALAMVILCITLLLSFVQDRISKKFAH